MKRPPVSVGSLRGMGPNGGYGALVPGGPGGTLRSGPSRGSSPVTLIEQLSPGRVPVVIPDVDERAARSTLREQIGRLERELVSACLDACPRLAPPAPLVPSRGGPRLLSLGELERVRDDLAERLADVR